MPWIAHAPDGTCYIKGLNGRAYKADFCLQCGRPDDSKKPPCTCLADWMAEGS